MSILTISLKIPFEIDASRNFGSRMIFTHWLPYGFDNGITVRDDDMEIILWFDNSCVPSEKCVDQLKRYVNLGVNYIKVTVRLDGVSDDLLAHMQRSQERETTSESHKGLETQYWRLGIRVLTTVFKRVNRLIAAVRTTKGQHWLQEHTVEFNRLQNTCLKYECRGEVDNGKSFSFCPGPTDTLYIRGEGETRYISELDWPEIAKFVVGEGKTDLGIL